MPFHEKSAWIMTFTLLLGGAFYFYAVNSLSVETGGLAAPTLPILVIYTIILILLAIVGHIAVAIFSPREAETARDERERSIVTRAGNVSRYAVGVGVVLSLGIYLLSHDGDLLFYAVLVSMMIGQLLEYLLQILFYRTAL